VAAIQLQIFELLSKQQPNRPDFSDALGQLNAELVNITSVSRTFYKNLSNFGWSHVVNSYDRSFTLLAVNTIGANTGSESQDVRICPIY